MKNNFAARGIAWLACLPVLQAAQAASEPEPKVPSKATPQLTYRSAFAGYKPYKDEPPADWRKLNDALVPAQAGASGHAGHGMGRMGRQGAQP